jgi:hypothetical protein
VVLQLEDEAEENIRIAVDENIVVSVHSEVSDYSFFVDFFGF